MQITEIRIKLLENTSSRQRLCAFCSIILDDAFVVRDIKILSGNQGYFIAMPSRRSIARIVGKRIRLVQTSVVIAAEESLKAIPTATC